MWRKGLGIGAVTLLVGGIYLHHIVSTGARGDGKSRAPVDTELESAQAPPPDLTRASSHPAPATSSQATDDPAISERMTRAAKIFKDPEGAHKALAYVGQNLGSPAAKVEAIRRAITESGPCADSICLKTKESLQARIHAAGGQFRGPLVAESVECFEVACIVDVTAPPDTPLQLVLDRLRESGQLDWSAPAMYSIPVIASDRTQSSTWMLFNPAS